MTVCSGSSTWPPVAETVERLAELNLVTAPARRGVHDVTKRSVQRGGAPLHQRRS
eukprot:SAG25_NODE_5691_length_630_cov_1.005650_1_plen_54_part_10